MEMAGKMDVPTMIREQLAFTHQIAEQAVADLTPEQLYYQVPGGTTRTIAGTYIHVVTSEDGMIHNWIAGKPTVFEANGWSERLGFEIPPRGSGDDWTAKVRLNDLAAFREYAQQVYAATDAYLTSVTDEQLNEKRQTPLGEKTVANILGPTLVWHDGQHTGEICALKGVLGLKGLPF